METRRGARVALALGALGLVTSVACTDPKGALMLAINTDMKAPKDVSVVSVTLSVNRQIKYNYIGRVTPDGRVDLPATLAIVQPDDPNASIRVRVVAFQEKTPRVLRDVRTTIPRGGRVGLMRVQLNFVDDGSGAGTLPDDVYAKLGPPSSGAPAPGPAPGPGSTLPEDGNAAAGSDFDPGTQLTSVCPDPEQTQVNGECVDTFVDSEALPSYEDKAVFGGPGASGCFDLKSCVAGAKLLDVDRATCSAPLEGAVGDRFNVAIVTPNTGECIKPGECYVPLERGPGGYRIQDGKIRLPAALCKLKQAEKARLAISTSCAPKDESQPICRPEAHLACPALRNDKCGSCIQLHCASEAKPCFGVDWTKGTFDGACKPLIECLCACGNAEQSCLAACDKKTGSDTSNGKDPCSQCLETNVGACAEANGCNCGNGNNDDNSIVVGVVDLDVSACKGSPPGTIRPNQTSFRASTDGTFDTCDGTICFNGNISPTTINAKIRCNSGTGPTGDLAGDTKGNSDPGALYTGSFTFDGAPGRFAAFRSRGTVTYQGFVRNRETKAPIGGATAKLTGLGDAVGSPQVTSDANGTFYIVTTASSNAAVPSYTVTVSAPGCQQAAQTGNGGTPAGQLFELVCTGM